MDTLSDVSETALITLRARAIEAQKDPPILHDPMGVELLDRLRARLPAETRQRMLDRPFSMPLARHLALRARKYDNYVRQFLQEHPRGLVVSLGSGFDTRYWRISQEPWRYVEIDLPEVIAAKRELLAERADDYILLGCSVLEDRWIEQVRAMQDCEVLFLAEGLFMYLPKPGVMHIFRRLSETFSRSQIVFEVISARYTEGLWKKAVESKMRHSAGTEAGSSYQCGLRNAQEVETYGPHIRVLEEWSYFEDPDIWPKALGLFRHIKPLARTQWTVQASIG